MQKAHFNMRWAFCVKGYKAYPASIKLVTRAYESNYSIRFLKVFV